MNQPNPKPTISPPAEIACSREFPDCLREMRVSLALTTYQTNRLFLIGVKPNGQLSVFERIFDRAMGLYATPERLYVSTRYQLWQLDNVLSAGEEYEGFDKLYVPRLGQTTGDVNAHEIVAASPPTQKQEPADSPTEKGRQGRIVFVNTLFSCLATPHPKHSFNPIWKPPFISKLVPEDKCHLNGVALENGVPAYVTVCGTADTAAGWRDHRQSGGAVIDVRTDEIVCTGLSMPHSPRFYQGKLWLLNSGTGDLGYVDREKGTFQPVSFCPGFVRGLAFYGNFAIVGMSQPRHQNFSGLALDERLAKYNIEPKCGLSVLDLSAGKPVAWFEFTNAVKELFDVAVLPGVRRPMALGFQSDEIERLVTFPGASGVLSTRPTVGEKPVTPQPSAPQGERGDMLAKVKYQMVYNLTAENSIEYDALSFPSLKKRWQKHKQRGEILAVSAAISEQLVGFVFAEILAESQTGEIISLFVAPECRHQGIGTAITSLLEKGLAKNGCRQVSLSYQKTVITDQSLEPMLRKLNWDKPQIKYLLGQTTTDKISPAPWLHKYPLSAAFTVFPWSEVTAEERQKILLEGGYPESLSPFGDEPRIEPLNSLGLRYNGEVVGWMICHRVAPDTIRYSALYVRERFQKLGRGISLLAEAIKRQIASPVAYYNFAVSAENPQMLQFVNRRLKRYLSGLSESRQSVKRLS